MLKSLQFNPQFNSHIRLLNMKRSAKKTDCGSHKSPRISDKEMPENRPDGLSSLMETFQQKRLSFANNVLDMSYQKKRARLLTTQSEILEGCQGPVIYWMWRDMRVQDNWTFLYSQRLALKFKVPLVVCVCLMPEHVNATWRHYNFMLQGLEEVAQECNELNIGFQILQGPAQKTLIQFVHKHQGAVVICDFSPLRDPIQCMEEVKNNLPDTVPLVQVDAHNIVPVWVASNKQEYAARTIRSKINTKLVEYLTEFPPLIKHTYCLSCELPKISWKSIYKNVKCDKSVSEVPGVEGGYKKACQQLEMFCEKRLKYFHDKRNDPTVDALSGLSPWFHFGHISAQRCILHVKEYENKFKESVAAFCEEAIIRRELSDNFCFYNKNYDRFEGLPAWSQKTLNEHCKDKRSPCYSLEKFEKAVTHDDLWNAAQLQLVREGKMHGFLRMYWAKKILEWSQTPKEALNIAIMLNDKYSLDGLDPNGYVGCMWSIGGLHDQGWAERPIFGKIRYMNYQGCKRKFNVAAFVTSYCN